MDRWSNDPITGYTYQGLNWYVLPTYTSVSNTQSLYSLLNSNITDHMTANITTASGYICETPTGWAKAFNAPDNSIGTKSIDRWVKYWNATTDIWGNVVTPFRYDHVTGGDGESFSSSGYTKEGALGAGWPTKEILDPTTLDITYSTKGDLSLGVSKTWGGAISSLKWKGTEFVNRTDLGRLLQADIGYTALINPTEGGDGWGKWAGTQKTYENGSPLVFFNQTSTSIHSACLPLYFSNTDGDFSPAVTSLLQNVSALNPMLSGDVIEKFDSIAKADSVGVIQHDVRYTLSRSRNQVFASTDSTSQSTLEVLAFCIPPENFYASTMANWNGNTWTTTGTPTFNGSAVNLDPNAPANPVLMISTDATNQHAVGVYFRPYTGSACAKGCWEYYQGFNQTTSNNPNWPVSTGPISWNFGKFQRAYLLRNFSKGEVMSFRQYIIIGTASAIWNEATHMAQSNDSP